MTAVGLTFGQLLAVLSLAGGILAAWINLSNQLINTIARVTALERDRARLEMQLQELSHDNRQDHLSILEQMRQDKSEILSSISDQKTHHK